MKQIDMEENRFMESESTEMEQKNSRVTPEENGDSVPTEEDAPRMEQENDTPESGDDTADSEDGADEMPDSDNNFGDSANDGTEQPPCDWKNASGEDDGEEDDLPPNDIPAGEPVSLRDAAFSDLLDICDSKINQALRTMFELKQNSFTFNAKITFENRGGAFGIKHEAGFNFDPIKVKDKGELYEEIPIRLNDNGDPIIPYDREHQLSFDETQPGQREVSPSGTATVDGKTGIVEGYQEDGRDPDESSADGQPEDDDENTGFTGEPDREPGSLQGF